MSVRPEVRAARAYHFTPRPARIKLDQNESPYDLPPELKRKVWARLQEVSWNRYSELAAESLRAAIARFHGWDEAGVVVSSAHTCTKPALF
jgi:histidinol-phosphate aminotransferase